MLRDFLRSRRARVAPEDAGVPLGESRRRVPGLRREEVAQLAGISVDYYIRFEQGRCPNVSSALLESVARILRLTPIEYAYLCTLVQASAARARATLSRTGDQQLSSGMRLLLDNLATPAIVVGRLLELLAVNEPARALFHGLEAHGNYLRWLLSGPASNLACADWSAAAYEAVAMLRFDVARHPHDPTFAAFVDELTATSSEFCRVWAGHEVDPGWDGRRRYRHPLAGEIVLHSKRLDVPDEPSHTLFTYSVVLGSSSDAALRRLTRATRSVVGHYSDLSAMNGFPAVPEPSTAGR
ncbi:helix-turn-helix domain-containing protein [Micromonospora sp. CA-259024]|uniref:helix-turn-helix domain-containing protein n=1 Tax=Micromonospora sp. CA-259024 TaxID=3239965 RepID=UPI003D8CB348